MDKLRELLVTFSEEERDELRFFLNRYRHVHKRKDGELLKLLVETDMDSAQMVKAIYKDPGKMDAYHTLRKRLFRQMTHFVMLKRMAEEGTNKAKVMGNFNLAQYLFERDCSDIGWKYLIKAENDALNNDEFSLLHDIYLLQLENFESNSKMPLMGIIKKLEENKIVKEEDERFNVASSLVKQLYTSYKGAKEGFDLELEINKIIKQYHLEQAFANRPKFLFSMIQIIRKGKMTKKDFYSFEPFVINQYKNILNSKGFSEKDKVYQAGILYVIAHTLFRNKKFDESLIYVRDLKGVLENGTKAFAKKLLGKCILLQAANLAYTNRVEEAHEALDEIINESKSLDLKLTATINKCVYYHFQGKYREGNKLLFHIEQTDKQIEKRFGLESLLKKILLEIVFQFDIENYEIVINKVRNLHRTFAEVFKQPMYQRVKLFTTCIRDLAMNPSLLGNKEAWEKINAQFQSQPFEEEDLQAMTYFAWLRARMNGVDYYEGLIEHLKSSGNLEYLNQLR